MIEDRKIRWLVLPMRCVLFLAAFSFCGIASGKDLTEISHWWSVLAVVINLITIAVLWAICKRGGTTYREMMRFGGKKKSLPKGLLFVICMLLLGMGGMYLAGWLCYGRLPYLAPMMIAPISPYLAVLNVFLLPLTTTVAEDGVYLGCGVNGFASEWAAVLIPAFFYALQHSFIPTIWDIRFMLWRFLSFLPLTVWICFQYRRGKPVLFVMVGHWFLNIATAVQIVWTSFCPEMYAVLAER